MKLSLHKPEADVYLPDSSDADNALKRTTHLGIGAHQDDLEFMCFHGIKECFMKKDLWYSGITVTNGGGCSRSGRYSTYSDPEMMRVRLMEQRKAALLGDYSAMIQLGYSSTEIKDPANQHPEDDLANLLAVMRPQIIYTHHFADKHSTHIGVVSSVIKALRRLPKDQRPERVLGCEGWRNLDWLPDNKKILLDVSGHEHLLNSLMGVFDSQIGGGKRYDLATAGRKRANATYYESHGSDRADMVEFAVDLTPLIEDDTLNPLDFTRDLIRSLEQSMTQEVKRFF